MRFIFLFISLVFLSGCANSWYIGKWTVTDVEFPAVSAVSYEEAREWFGSEAIYSKSLYSFRNNSCGAPQFELESMTESDFYLAYRASFAQLGIEGNSVEILRVTCPDASVFAGSTLIKVTGDILYAPWDGAFFRFERNAS